MDDGVNQDGDLRASVRHLLVWVKVAVGLTILACFLQFGLAVGVVEGAGKAASRLGALRDENASLRTENASMRAELDKLHHEASIPR